MASCTWMVTRLTPEARSHTPGRRSPFEGMEMSGANARLGEQRSLAKADRPSDPWQVEELEDKRASARTAMANGEIDDLPMHQNHDRAEAFERLEPSVLQQQGHALECIDRGGLCGVCKHTFPGSARGNLSFRGSDVHFCWLSLKSVRNPF